MSSKIEEIEKIKDYLNYLPREIYEGDDEDTLHHKVIEIIGSLSKLRYLLIDFLKKNEEILRQKEVVVEMTPVVEGMDDLDIIEKKLKLAKFETFKILDSLNNLNNKENLENNKILLEAKSKAFDFVVSRNCSHIGCNDMIFIASQFLFSNDDK
jgi:hypothetical protein